MNLQQHHILQGLYGISDCNLTPKSHIFLQLDEAIKGGLRIFQYRDKDSKDNEIYHLVQELQEVCIKNQVLFVLNDRYELAITLQTQGLHLGKEELKNFAQIRQSYKNIIGVSCYNNIDMAIQYEGLGANYVAFGAMFASKIKPNATQCEIETLTQARKKLHIPICAIGGITPENAYLLQDCDMIAVISSLWQNARGQDSKAHLSNSLDSLQTIRYNAQNLIASWKNH